MTETTRQETRQFQAEAKQLLHLMTHSLYSNREIFLRELISNASDACDKLRFEALANADLLSDGEELRVRITIDAKKRLLTIEDNGIGMSWQEVIDNIGTIASSGTSKFLENLSGDQKKDSALIGQFGVGFYSAFIVADRVELFTRRAGSNSGEGVHWTCTGEAEYEIAACDKEQRGTRVVLHLKKDMKEFSDNWRIRSIITKYSEHIAIAVQMKNDDGGEETFETINAAVALWTRPRNEVSEDEYKAFYRQLTHDFKDPLLWSHNRVEGKLDYTSLLYVPAKAPADLWRREGARGLKLYIRRTFVLDDAEQFLPSYLRFIKGVLDTNDLPLNVSRELLQDSPQVTKIRSALTKRVLDLLAKTAKKGGDAWQELWNEFGPVLKEGVVEDPDSQAKLVDIYRFATTHQVGAEQNQSLADYVSRMQDNQEGIYYLTGESHSVLSRSPLLESFRKAGLEVILLSDGIDEWLMSNLTEYESKKFVDVARGDLKLDGKKDDSEADSEDKQAEESPLVARLKSVIGDQLADIRVSTRLVESPSCLVLGEFDLSLQMRRLMEASGQKMPESKPVLEINPDHPLVQRMQSQDDEARFEDLALVLLDQARLANGDKPVDPAAYVQRINRLLLEL